jgi:hypothetical protein
LDTEDFFSGLALAVDAINAPAAKQLTKIKPLLFMLFLLLISLSDSWLHGNADAQGG